MAEYKGDVCYVGHDHEAADGTMLEGGWHYSVVGEGDASQPGEKLVIDDKGKYRLAVEGDQSHRDENHQRLALIAVEGQLGDVVTAEEIDAARRHLDNLEKNLEAE